MAKTYKLPELAPKFWDEIGWRDDMLYLFDSLDGDETYKAVFYALCRSRKIQVPKDLYIECYSYAATIYNSHKEQKDIEGYLNERDKSSSVKISIAENGCNVMISQPTKTQLQMSAAFIPIRLMQDAIKEKPLTPEETELLRHLSTANIEKFSIQFESMFAEDIAETDRCKFADLANILSTSAYKTRIDGLEKQIAERNAEMEDLINRANSLNKMIRNWTAELYGYKFAEEQASQNNAELEEFLRTMSSSIKVTRTNTMTNVRITGVLKFSGTEKFIANYSRFMTPEIKAVLECVIAPKSKFQILCASAFRVWDDGSLSVDADAMRELRKDNGLIPNPHHDYFGCLGGYVGIVGDAMRQGDWIQTLMSLKASAQNVNCMDNAVMSRFLDNIRTSKKYCIYNKETGEVMTFAEAYKVLKSE